MDYSQTESGDLALTVDFDLKIGDDQQSALRRLLEHWRYNEPWLRENFEYVMNSFEKDRLLDAEVWELAPRIRQEQAMQDRYHEIKDEMGALTFGRAASTGAIMVVLTNLLRRLWVDLERPQGWESATPQFFGYSFGQIVDAAANDFRHFDEWARVGNKPPKKEQLSSIAAIASVLGKTMAPDGSNHPIRGKFGPEVLVAISDRSFDLLNERFFAFARVLAKI